MSKVFIQESTLTAIGDAIREKSGSSELIAPLDMATEIANLPTGGGGGEVEPIELTGSCNNVCSGDIADAYIKLYGHTITTKDITSASSMFRGTQLERIPFDINLVNTGNGVSLSYAFSGQPMRSSKLKTLPKVTGRVSDLGNVLWNQDQLTEIPEYFYKDMDFTPLDQYLSTAVGSTAYGFCFTKIKEVPFELMNHGHPSISSGRMPWCGSFNGCSRLRSIKLPAWMNNNTNAFTNSTFSSSFSSNHSLRSLVFDMPNGVPFTLKAKSQTIDLTQNVGYGTFSSKLGPVEAQIKDDATYQALKNHPDRWTNELNYSLYNKASAIETINSLPDTSAYLATAGGTNTIKFKGNSGALTDAGAINTLTEAEIAVATAKGWTVTFA